MTRFWDGESSAAEREEFYRDTDTRQWELCDRISEIERQREAAQLLTHAEGVRSVIDYSEASSEVDSELARAFRNLDFAFGGAQYAIDAVLQAVRDIRARFVDAAVVMLENEAAL